MVISMRIPLLFFIYLLIPHIHACQEMAALPFTLADTLWYASKQYLLIVMKHEQHTLFKIMPISMTCLNCSFQFFDTSVARLVYGLRKMYYRNLQSGQFPVFPSSKYFLFDSLWFFSYILCCNIIHI